MEGSNPFVNEVKTFLCLRSCPSRTIKHVPALLQTAVSFHTLYSVNEKSNLVPRVSLLPAPCLSLATGGGKKRDPGNEVAKSLLLLCPGFRNINLRTPGSFGMLFTRGRDEISR